jgi:hypothetical protein
MFSKPIAAPGAALLAAALVGTAGASLIHRLSAPATGTKVTVHGQWTIVVRNKSRKVVARRHFENALVSSGAGTLAKLLAGQGAAGSWGVNIGCCAIIDSNNSTPDGYPFFKNLVVTAPTTGADANKVVLSGTATPTADFTINAVDTYLSVCTSPATAGCISPANPGFTHKALDGVGGDPAAVPVAAGQQVSVTVKLSFS